MAARSTCDTGVVTERLTIGDAEVVRRVWASETSLCVEITGAIAR